MKNYFIIPIFASIFISIMFAASITGIETSNAYHNKFHLNNSFTDVTISADFDISDQELENMKKSIERDLEAEENKANQNNSISQLPIKSNTDNSKAKIILTSHKYTENDDSDLDDLFGQVKNVGNGTAEDVTVIFTYYDANGNAIGNDDTGIYANILKPGQKSAFLDFRHKLKTQDMTYYEISLSWYNPDGTQDYIENVDVTKDSHSIPVIEKEQSENIPFGNTLDENIKNSDDEDDEEDKDDKDDEDEDEDEDDEDD